MGKRTAEFAMALIGGILGFCGAIIALFIGNLVAAFGSDGGFLAIGFSAMLFSVLGIVSAALVKAGSPKKVKIAGILMLISAFGGIISISWAYSLAFVLLFIAGLMTLLRKEGGETH